MDELLGTVAWFDNEKGYGLLTRITGAEVYVRATDFQDEAGRKLMPRDEVSFDLIHAPDGRERAVNVKMVKAAADSAPLAA